MDAKQPIAQRRCRYSDALGDVALADLLLCACNRNGNS